MREYTVQFIKSCGRDQPKITQAYLTLREDLNIDINDVDDSGRTAAVTAARASKMKSIRMLAATGMVDWNKVDWSGTSPLHLAMYNGHAGIASIILQDDNVNLGLKTRDGATVGMAAVIGGNMDCVRTLAQMEYFHFWNISNNLGVTPVLEAIMTGKRNIFKSLIDCPRVDINLQDKDGNSPLMSAIKEGETIMAKLMIRCSRVDLSTRDKNGASLQRISRWGELK